MLKLSGFVLMVLVSLATLLTDLTDHVNVQRPVDSSVPFATSVQNSQYPLHKNITATVFWVGEPRGNGSSEDNAISAYDDDWLDHFGGVDDPARRNGYHPAGFTPGENPFYLDLPYELESMKNRWVKLIKGGKVCYGQIEDAGPYVYDDYNYVFGTSLPKNSQANNAGLDVSPALRDCLGFVGTNNDQNKVDWQFVDSGDVPSGPWREIITTSHVNWH